MSAYIRNNYNYAVYKNKLIILFSEFCDKEEQWVSVGLCSNHFW